MAVALGIVFHTLLLLVFDQIELFSPAMWTGYLAFFDPAPVTETEGQPVKISNLRLSAAAAWILMMVVMPLRVYAWPGRDIQSLSFFDPSPWAYEMFLIVQEVNNVDAQYQSAGGRWLHFPLKGRMVWTNSDSDLLALAEHIFAARPEARSVRLQTSLVINRRRVLQKELRMDRGKERAQLTAVRN